MQTPSSTTEHNVHPVYRPDIDGLRAVGILSVVVFHAFPNTLLGGFVGVDIFFVISGFLISSIIFRSLSRGDFSFTEFYAHRIKRIFPALILVLTASYIFGWFMLLPDEFKQLGKHIAASMGFVQNFVLREESGYFDTASELKPLMHLWSLAIEEQFYLIYPLLIWSAWRSGLNMLTVVLVLALLSFGLNINDIGKDVVKTFFLPKTRFWELLLGGGLAYLQLFKHASFTGYLKRGFFHPLLFRSPPPAHQQEAVMNNVLSTFGLLFIITAIFVLRKSKLFPGWWALLPVIGAVFLIFAGPQTWINRKILANRVMVRVGLISYPLYLCHWPLLSFARIIESEAPSQNIRIAAVAMSFLLAWLTYQLLEKPIRFGRNTWIKTAVLCVLAAIVGFAGYNAFKNEKESVWVGHEALLKTAEQFNWPKSNVFQPDCFLKYGLISSYCLVNNILKEPSILIVGDSHGNHLYPGMAEVITGTTETVFNFGQAACLPFFNVALHQIGEKDACVSPINLALKFAEEHDSVRVVIMSSRGYLSGGGVYQLALTDKPELSDDHLIIEIAMRTTLTRLITQKKQIIFVLDVPQLDFDPKSCVEIRPLRLTTNRQPCAVPRQDFEMQYREYRTLVLSVLKDFPSVKVFDAAASLCDAQWCWAMKGGKMLYRDNNHLSLEGSRYIAKELVKEITTLKIR